MPNSKGAQKGPPSSSKLQNTETPRPAPKPPNPVVVARWHLAYKKVRMAQLISRGFGTLRDHYGVNEVRPSQLKKLAILGHGAFATVEKAEYTMDGGEKKIVAVKKLKPDIMQNEVDVKSFMNEVSLLRKLDHPNIMRYVGIGSADSSSDKLRMNTLFLVCELMEGGTLKKLVMAQMSTPHKQLYNLTDALRWSINVAEAIAYLHKSRPSVIHRDLKLENILLKGITRHTQVACLADFGLAAFKRNHNVLYDRRTTHKKVPTADYDEGVAAMMERMAPQAPHLERKTGIAGMLEASVKGGKALFNPSSHGGSGSGVKMGASSVRGGNLFLEKSLRAGNAFEKIAMQQDKSMKGSKAYRPQNLPMPKALLSGKTGSLMYMSPEMWRNENDYTEKVDVFSFGVIMYELFHKYAMFFAISINGTEEEIDAYAQRVSEGYRPSIHEQFPEALRSLINDCWAQDPQMRPSMTAVAERLYRIQEVGTLVGTDVPPSCCTVS